MVKLTVYDVNGRKLIELANGMFNPGHYKFDWDGRNYSSGIYFYKIEAFNFTATKKMLLVK